MTAKRHTPDPPMQPMSGSKWWIETESSALEQNPELATLIVRLGLAMNAIDALDEILPAVEQMPQTSPIRMRTVFNTLLTYAALTREGLNILTGSGGKTGQYKTVLRLARKGDVAPTIVRKVKRLTGGTHRACAILTVMRNQLAFHWDPDLLKPAVADFAKNESIVWVESDGERLIQRFAIEVVAFALFANPHGTTEQAVQDPVTRALTDIQDAGHALVVLFHRAIQGYLLEIGGERRDAKEST